MENKRKNKILTFDIEEWFHILDHESVNDESKWNNYECRIFNNMDIIFEILSKNKCSATFFVVGWIAEKYPEIIKRINNNGYEIGSHTNRHQLVYSQSPQIFNDDLSKSIKTLEDITGKKIKYFRAPGFSITSNTKWAFEILYENGITHDCSIFPSSRAHGGFPSYNHSYPSIIKYNGVLLKEFPINTKSFFLKKIIFSGGGYFRILPYNLIKKLTTKSDYVMTYFHPRDFDINQPVIKDLDLIRKFKCYVGLKKTKHKLEKLLNDFDFHDIKSADENISWSNVPVVNL